MLIKLFPKNPLKHIQGRIPIPTKEVENIDNVGISMNITSNEIIASNSSYVKITSPIAMLTVESREGEEAPGQDYWPNWIRQVICISHLCLAFNSSVNFYIYYIKRKTLNSGNTTILSMSVIKIHIIFP